MAERPEPQTGAPPPGGASARSSIRTCIVTRRERPPEELIRFVVDPAGKVTPDLRRKLPGRGAWVTASADCVARAAASKAFARAFKREAKADATLAADVESLLESDAVQALSLANKAGLVTSGAAKVEAAIARERPAAVIQARDGAADGARKLKQALVRRWGEAGAQLPWVDAFDSRQLDLALGRSNVIHAALKPGPATAAFVAHCRRLSRYRGAPDPDTNELTAASPEPVFGDLGQAEEK